MRNTNRRGTYFMCPIASRGNLISHKQSSQATPTKTFVLFVLSGGYKVFLCCFVFLSSLCQDKNPRAIYNIPVRLPEIQRYISVFSANSATGGAGDSYYIPSCQWRYFWVRDKRWPRERWKKWSIFTIVLFFKYGTLSVNSNSYRTFKHNAFYSWQNNLFSEMGKYKGNAMG